MTCGLWENVNDNAELVWFIPAAGLCALSRCSTPLNEWRFMCRLPLLATTGEVALALFHNSHVSLVRLMRYSHFDPAYAFTFCP